MTVIAGCGLLVAMRALLLAALLGAAPEPVAGDRPVEMTAKGGLWVDLKKQIGVAKGDVVVRRDDVVVCCDKAEATFEERAIKRVECVGNVVIVRPDGTRARADKAVFEAKADTVTLTGKARVESPAADLEGESIVYDIASDKLEVQGSKARFRYTPKPEPLAPPPRACPPP